MRLTADRNTTATSGISAEMRDTAIALMLVLATFATRFPFRSHRVFNWDAVNFVLALSDYDVRLHHPHPPGYPVFIAMGRLVQIGIPNPNTALVTVAMILSVLAVLAIYRMGTTVFDRPTGSIAAVYLMVSVTFWTNGAVALAYAALAVYSTSVALQAWRCWRDGRSVPAWTPFALSAAYAIGGGFRPDLLLFLLPLWIFGHWRLGFRRAVLSGLLVVAIVLAWFVPTIALSGGWTEYWKVFRTYTSNDVLKRYSVAENGPRAFVVNIRDTVKYAGYALYALALPVAGGGIWLLTKIRHWRNPLTTLFALWMTPMLLFYTWLHIGDPGYVFTFLPALLLIGARFTAEIPRLLRAIRLPRNAGVAVASALMALVIVTNTGIFLFRPLALTAHGIRQQDRTIDGKIAYIRSHGDPASTLLISYESYRHWLLYLPEYRVQFVDVTYGTEQDRTVTVPPGTTRLILMDATLLRVLTDAKTSDEMTIEADRVAVVPSSGSPLHFASVASPLNVQTPKP